MSKKKLKKTHTHFEVYLTRLYIRSDLSITTGTLKFINVTKDPKVTKGMDGQHLKDVLSTCKVLTILLKQKQSKTLTLRCLLGPEICHLIMFFKYMPRSLGTFEQVILIMHIQSLQNQTNIDKNNLSLTFPTMLQPSDLTTVTKTGVKLLCSVVVIIMLSLKNPAESEKKSKHQLLPSVETYRLENTPIISLMCMQK